MYDPVFNSVLVEIDDKDAQWGSGNDESMLGASFSKGTVVKLADMIPNKEHPADQSIMDDIKKLQSKQIMWNEGTEAGTIFEHESKKYGFIYWWDIRGTLADA